MDLFLKASFLYIDEERLKFSCSGYYEEVAFVLRCNSEPSGGVVKMQTAGPTYRDLEGSSRVCISPKPPGVTGNENQWNKARCPSSALLEE